MLLTKFQIVIKLILISDCMKESVLTHSLTQKETKYLENVIDVN